MPGKANVARSQADPSDSLVNAAVPSEAARPRIAPPGCSPALTRCPLFVEVSGDERSAILAGARIREFDRGDVLHFEGDPVERILLLLSGYAKTTKFGESGTVAILGLAAPGDALGATGLISSGRYTTTAEPVQHCRALVWPAAGFRSLLDRFPRLYQNMVQIHLGYVQELEERFHEMATEIVSRRVARQLVRLHDLFGSTADPGEICLSHEELAQMTGTTLFSISRLITEWEARGLVVARRYSVTVRNVASLRAIAE